MDLDLREHPTDYVGVCVGDFSNVLDAVGLDDDEASGTVGERPGQSQTTQPVLSTEVLEMGRPQARPQLLCIRSITADNNEQHAPPPVVGRGRAEPEETGAYPSMDGDERQWALERLASGMEELKTVLGPGAASRVEGVKLQLLAAMAARDRGDRTATLTAIARAMAGLADLGDGLDAAEGAMMRAVAAGFIRGMAREDREQVERHLDVIQSRAGTPKAPEKA